MAKLSAEQITDVLALLQGADSAELKLTVPESHQSAAILNLGLDPLDARLRQVFFFDTPDLALDRAGVVVRARRIQDASGDAVVKLRPVVPDKLDRGVRRAPGFSVEVDAMPGGFVCSGAFKVAATNEAIRDVASGRRATRKLFTKPQRRLFEQHAPGGAALDDLAVLGPINVLKLKYRPRGIDRKLAAELWMYPDGSRILELSTKCAPEDALRVAAEARAYLEERGLDLDGRQETKTKAALRHFAKQAAAATAAAQPGR